MTCFDYLHNKHDVVQIIGTRPQYIKLIDIPGDFVIDTGQHYDASLQRDIPSGSIDFTFQWVKPRQIVDGLMQMLDKINPKIVIVYGDTFSTLCGCVAANRMNLPVMHIEAGVRTGVWTIEEKIRCIVDDRSDYVLAPTMDAFTTLVDEGHVHAYWVGDIMYERFLDANEKHKSNIILMTIHRRENLESLPQLFSELKSLNARVHFYVHPHTLKYLELNQIPIPDNISMYDPTDCGHIRDEFHQAKLVITDSGGLVREAYWSGIRCRFIGINPWADQTEAFGIGNTSTIVKEVVEDVLKDLSGELQVLS